MMIKAASSRGSLENCRHIELAATIGSILSCFWKMMVPELETHAPLKADHFTLTHFKIWYDFVRHVFLRLTPG